MNELYKSVKFFKLRNGDEFYCTISSISEEKVIMIKNPLVYSKFVTPEGQEFYLMNRYIACSNNCLHILPVAIDFVTDINELYEKYYYLSLEYIEKHIDKKINDTIAAAVVALEKILHPDVNTDFYTPQKYSENEKNAMTEFLISLDESKLIKN